MKLLNPQTLAGNFKLMAKRLKDVKAPNRTVNFKAGKNIALEGSGDNVTVATVDNA